MAFDTAVDSVSEASRNIAWPVIERVIRKMLFQVTVASDLTSRKSICENRIRCANLFDAIVAET